MPNSSIVITAAFLLLFLVVVIYAIRWNRRAAEEFQRYAQAHGWRVVAKSDPAHDIVDEQFRQLFNARSFAANSLAEVAPGFYFFRCQYHTVLEASSSTAFGVGLLLPLAGLGPEQPVEILTRADGIAVLGELHPFGSEAFRQQLTVSSASQSEAERVVDDALQAALVRYTTGPNARLLRIRMQGSSGGLVSVMPLNTRDEWEALLELARALAAGRFVTPR